MNRVRDQEPCPEIGDFEEYDKQLALFSACSTEKGIELVKIGMVIASLPKRQAFLDVGAGGGHLTVPVSEEFMTTTVVEPDPRQAAMFRTRCPHFRVYNEDWTNVHLETEQFDLILCSHVLYYIPPGAWMGTIEKMYRHLAPGGSLIIVMQSPYGEVARFFTTFTPYDIPIIELEEEALSRYGHEAVTLESFQNEIFTESLDDMVEIGLFLLVDRHYRAHSPEIRRYFQDHHAVSGGYRIVQDEILLAIRKIPPSGGPSLISGVIPV
jgi:SAM-dependent methyltransferase